jgi:5-carboxyvanillate decarboxylase
VKKIAVEEAFATEALVKEWRVLLDDGAPGEAGLDHNIGRIINADGGWGAMASERLMDLGESRLQHMDEGGVDMQLIGITAPGVQVFDADTAQALSEEANDVLADAVKAHPDRFAGLAAIAPQAPKQAAKELERAIGLGFKGAMVNSHTKGEYLDAVQYSPILEAAESLGVPIYIHPRHSPPAAIAPFAERHLEAAIWGFQTETALHALRLIVTGAFDRYPNLTIVLGHLGEGLPFWLDRIDRSFSRSRRAKASYPHWRCEGLPSEYFLKNFAVCSSGHNWAPAVKFVESVVGEDNLMFAIDYPYEENKQQVDQAAEIDLAAPEKFYELNARRIFKLD